VTVVTGALITQLKLAKIFLGYDWLRATNPQIDWWKGKVTCSEMETPLVMRTIEETPQYTKEFPKAFSEGEFRDLPLRRKWDHQIDLADGHIPPRGKCYLLATREKEALRSFIKDNLEDLGRRKDKAQ
jgi:hypothetical protein